MSKTTAYQKKELHHDGMKISVEFPEPTENDSKIAEEIKNILTNALQEQMQKIS